jgi:hypothetical protein
MGENKHIKELDAFAKKYVKEIDKEGPSLGFTSNLMQKIVEENHQFSKIDANKPLISKSIWILLALAVVAVLFIPFKNNEESMFNFPDLNFSFLEKIQFSGFLETFTVSNTVLYAVLFFGIMLFAQVLFLKKYFNKNFE